MGKLLSIVSALVVVSMGCASQGRENSASAPPPPAAATSFLFAEPDTAVLVEWTENDGDLIGNVTAAVTNVAGGHVEQTVVPISGFLNDDGDVGLEYGKGTLAQNLTGRVDGQTLTLAGSFGLTNRTQLTLRAANPGDWKTAIAAVQATVDAALAAEREAADREAADRESAKSLADQVELSDDELGDPYVDVEAESRQFDWEIINVDGRSAAAESAVGQVHTAAQVHPMTQLQVSQVRAAVTVVDLAAADAQVALRRLETQYAELQKVLLDMALEPFTERLEDARRTVERADTARSTSERILADAEGRTVR